MLLALLYVRLALTIVMVVSLIAQVTGLRARDRGLVDKARKRLIFAFVLHGTLVLSYTVLGAVQHRSWDIIIAMIWLWNFYICHQALKKLPLS